MKRLQLLVLGLVAAACTGCSTVPVAVVPTPWAVVGAARFEAPAPQSEAPSVQALAIESQRHAGLVSEAEASAAALLAVRQ
jgi:photosystem II stability/assembly factor-like uncharacterized protein